MRSNTDLTIAEFMAAQNIKRAMIYKDDPDMVSKYLKIALEEIYRSRDNGRISRRLPLTR